MAEEEVGIGESWELSQVSGHISVIANGSFKGVRLDEWIHRDPVAVLGKSVYERFGAQIPLLFKLIDAGENLSVQVHPDDELAEKRHRSPGKTEMWYIIDAKPGAGLIAGFSKEMDPVQLDQLIASNQLMKALQWHEAFPGDVFFIPAGCVHALGAGLLVAEIQQSSDVTYRLYDYNRTDQWGKGRELHIDWARDAIDYRLIRQGKVKYEPVVNEVVPLVTCDYFTTNRLYLKAVEEATDLPISNELDRLLYQETSVSLNRQYDIHGSFVVFMCLKGRAYLRYSNKQSVMMQQGETWLLPAIYRKVDVITDNECLLLETYIR
jgi:mannose-6-phosphate isomerase